LHGVCREDIHDHNDTSNLEHIPDYGSASDHYANALELEYPQDDDNAAINSEDIIGEMIKPSMYFVIGSYK
jgi:hypothetical protein